ncbi:MAG: hypothetical protein WCV55_01550 [Candidatus Paceibacterota bacterium]
MSPPLERSLLEKFYLVNNLKVHEVQKRLNLKNLKRFSLRKVKEKMNPVVEKGKYQLMTYRIK